MRKLNQIISAAHAGGAVLRHYFGKSLTLKIKSTPADYQTIADIESEQAVISVLEKHFPSYNILGEESGYTNKNSEWEFVIDPLDGTNNFVLGVPFFSVSIGLNKNNELQYGVVYNPIIDKTYSAKRGSGAYMNGAKIQVNNVDDIKHSTISYAWDYTIGQADGKKKLAQAGVKRSLELWSPALVFCLIAEGKAEAYINEDGLGLHDFAGGKLIAKEAGAKITNLKGEKEEHDMNRQFIVSNGTNIHKKIVKIIN